MQAYELNQEQIVEWALHYASYEELEATAKALYSEYISRRRTEHPDQQAKVAKRRNRRHRTV